MFGGSDLTGLNPFASRRRLKASKSKSISFFLTPSKKTAALDNVETEANMPIQIPGASFTKSFSYFAIS
jgi:hypothetical protein